MQRICLVEDSAELQALFQHEFQDWYQVSCAGSIKAALSLFEKQCFDIVVLEVSLPDGSGLELCTRLKTLDRTKNWPVIFLTKHSDPVNKMMAFALGAEDYVVKPFEPIELRARIGARLRSSGMPHLSSAEEQSFGDLKFDMVKRRALSIEGQSERDLGLTPFEFKLLHFLAMRSEQIFGRSELQKHLNGLEVHVNEEGIYTHVSTLRRKLGAKKGYIECIPRVGYKFRGPEPKAAP
jgi:DNA-binding response OmpR family regulator